MILTGKAKEDFYKWYLKKIRERPDIGDRFWDENLISFFENAGHTMQNAFIIEWFDSVGYIITLRRFSMRLEFKDWYFIIENNRGCHLNNFLEDRVKNDDRNEVLSVAIKKANEIYNKTSHL